MSRDEQSDAIWDSGWDRVVRNEGRLLALEVMVAEVRASNTKLTEARWAQLDSEIVLRATALEKLTNEQHNSASQEFRDKLDAHSIHHEERLQAVVAAIAAQTERLTELATERARATDVASTVAKEAIAKAEQSNDKRFEAVNEFRQQLSDQAAHFMPRTESMAMHARNSERLQDLTDRMNTSQGRSAGYNNLYGWLVAGLGLIISIVIVVNVLTATTTG